MSKELKVKKIRNGTVIDHIPPGRAMDIIKILNVNMEEDTVLIAVNVDSSKMGKKDIIKIEGKLLERDEVDKVAIVAPEATVNIIKDYEVVKKFKVKPPETVEGVIKCPNPNCITNDEREPVRTRFVLESDDPPVYRCEYCERLVEADRLPDLIR
ncbi:MAG: aspartate carbamoyltransferase regulatory subunit [Methanopyri archaeon]|nr:aspartate carbamoyltransferase regulatory subunit [Methanopyri archaeon]